ncbi:7430_t:CDS:2 [Ambispora gerdemannii]|uniref:Dolichyl-diphosphooligosaccharide-protein glycosyltransferase subunit OST5 n=1 Tax=Ambispora gerdemannii TaxID=144530 RepID=A0A9N8ZEH3_9GLOM|nr:7430_t:CDS:2 [Ambispora gerdemannii]
MIFTALSDWESATPYTSLIPQQLFPVLALVLLLSGAVATSTFSVITASRVRDSIFVHVGGNLCVGDTKELSRTLVKWNE